jgi:hypothetical protein
VQFCFNIDGPNSIHHMFNGWLNGVELKLKHILLVGAFAQCWILWTK